MEWGEILLQNFKIHYLLKGKNRKITQKNEKARKKPKNPGQTGDTRLCVHTARSCDPTTMVCAHHHGQTVVVSGSAVSPFFERCVLVLLFGP